jgi:hypothetical protein
MRKFLRVLLRIVIVLVILIGVFAIYVQFAYDKKFNDTPYPNIKASTDPAIIARGKYLVYGPAHCAMCHAGNGQDSLVDRGQEIPLSGGFEIHLPLCVLRPRNLTSDKETGIGGLTDGEIARTLRYAVNHKGEAILPLMPFQDMSEDDMVAVISYLRTQAPVKHEIKPSEYNFIGKLIKLLLIRPNPPKQTPPQTIDRDSTAEYGKYLTTCVANCYGCHTDRNLKTGEFTGKPFSGGLIFPVSVESNGWTFVTPNLTPEMETGRIAGWDEATFIKRFRSGRIYRYSPMPWGPFSRLDEIDLKAIYRYLHSVPAVKNEVVKTAYQPGENAPEPK